MSKTKSKLFFGLSEKVYSSMVNTFSNQNKIQKILIFGSRAIGNFYEGSDIDLAIFTDKDFDREDYNKMYREIDDLGLLYQIDFVIYHIN